MFKFNVCELAASFIYLNCYLVNTNLIRRNSDIEENILRVLNAILDLAEE